MSFKNGVDRGFHIEHPAAASEMGDYHPYCGQPLFRYMEDAGLKTSACDDPCVLLPWIQTSIITFEERRAALHRWADYFFDLADDVLAMLNKEYNELVSAVDKLWESMDLLDMAVNSNYCDDRDHPAACQAEVEGAIVRMNYKIFEKETEVERYLGSIEGQIDFENDFADF